MFVVMKLMDIHVWRWTKDDDEEEDEDEKEEDKEDRKENAK